MRKKQEDPSPQLTSLATPVPQGQREKRVCVAQIGAAHGTRGEVRLWSFTADPMAVRDYGPLESEDGSARFEIEAVRPAKRHLVARLAGVHDRNAAERLTNIRLYVARERLPAAGADEFYHADLIGLAALAVDGRALGTVVAVHDFGAGDILELRPAGRNDTVMLPFTTETVPLVDIAGGRIVIDPPQGLFSE
ncbi:MAG: rRNA processing protein RimM [Alphaproteobacteria bacterium]|jgi:16S rRNA processing protein RimM|nr:rRNA processing protein RimM [Alphaproteobacteria bacterium]